MNRSDAAIAASIFWADLDAVDGVDLLYPRSQAIEQFGYIADFRIGLTKELSGDRFFEALLLYNQFKMTHDVSYMDQLWLEDIGSSVTQARTERNFDRSKTWGLHFGYVQPIPESEWRIGGILTANWKSHPKIPNYELMNIPRDPGNSWAYNIGLGFSRSFEKSTIGIDLVYEPIWSNTWADAADYVTTRSGHLLPPGYKTVENDFRFSDWILRMGLTSKENETFGFQLGLQARSIGYELDQKNYIEEFSRNQHERWDEWAATWGLLLNLDGLDIRYNGRWTTGTGRPGVDRRNLNSPGCASCLSADYILAPEGSLTLQNADVVTHQVTVAVPLTRQKAVGHK
ncbi:MAG: hypothetical protein ACYSR5_11450 [Planctomycetota bacterium]